MNSSFDRTATAFDRHRALPAGVAEAIRAAVWKTTGKSPKASVLDVGAGTGRIGRAFVEAGDFYVGVDLSWEMLREFAAHNPAASLIQADGSRLPFSGCAFDLVMLMQVLSGSERPSRLLDEVLRILTLHGAVVAGQTVMPSSGVDAQMKHTLDLFLKETGLVMHEPKKSRGQGLAWLEAHASQYTRVTAAKWMAERTPRQFITRHRTGARFAALPTGVQEKALNELSTWAEKTFGALDKKSVEEHSFELEVFELG